MNPGSCFFGATATGAIVINIGACNDGTNWKAVVETITGDYVQETSLAGGTEVTTGVGGNSTDSNYCAQMTELNALGHCPCVWYMISAVQAHENVHKAHLSPALNAAKGDISTLFSALTVPNTGQSEADAITAIKALSGYNTTLNNAYTTWHNEYNREAASDHNGPTNIAEHAVVDPMVTNICDYAKNKGWNASNPCTLCQ
jgi:hypothetical protein